MVVRGVVGENGVLGAGGREFVVGIGRRFGSIIVLKSLRSDKWGLGFSGVKDEVCRDGWKIEGFGNDCTLCFLWPLDYD
jgi:hypothetical protein